MNCCNVSDCILIDFCAEHGSVARYVDSGNYAVFRAFLCECFDSSSVARALSEPCRVAERSIVDSVTPSTLSALCSVVDAVVEESVSRLHGGDDRGDVLSLYVRLVFRLAERIAV